MNIEVNSQQIRSIMVSLHTLFLQLENGPQDLVQGKKIMKMSHEKVGYMTIKLHQKFSSINSSRIECFRLVGKRSNEQCVGNEMHAFKICAKFIE